LHMMQDDTNYSLHRSCFMHEFPPSPSQIYHNRKAIGIDLLNNS
jgi:hypothetical protein